MLYLTACFLKRIIPKVSEMLHLSNVLFLFQAMSSLGSMYLEFHTDYTITDKGWVAEYVTSRKYTYSFTVLLK